MNLKRLLITLIVVAASVILAGASVEITNAAGCNPNAYQVALYEHINYGGRCVLLNVGSYTSYPIISVVGMPARTVSSVKVGAGSTVRLCTGSTYTGRCETFVANDSWLGSNFIGNDSASSLILRRKPFVCVTISEVLDLNQSESADFYAKVWIGNKRYQTREVTNQDHIRPNWRVCGNEYSTYLPLVKIELWEEDSGLRGGDDHVDINVSAATQDIVWYVRPFTPTYCTPGRCGYSNSNYGNSGDQAQIWYRVDIYGAFAP